MLQDVRICVRLSKAVHIFQKTQIFNVSYPETSKKKKMLTPREFQKLLWEHPPRLLTNATAGVNKAGTPGSLGLIDVQASTLVNQLKIQVGI